MNNKKLIRLTEADLHRIVRESVNKVLNEGKYLPDGYDEEWEKNVDDDSNKRVCFDRSSKFGFPTYSNPYKAAKNRLGRLNDTDSVGQSNHTIFGFETNPNNPYGRKDWTYDRYGNKTWDSHTGHYDKDNLLFSDDEWDDKNDQPMQRTYREQPYEVKPSPFATDVRDLNKKTHMAKDGTYMNDLKRMKTNADNSYKRALDAADKRPLHRKGSLNRA